ncbi:MAG: choice-of-anchor Q domain-containing protein [Caldilineaceae bacterium]
MRRCISPVLVLALTVLLLLTQSTTLLAAPTSVALAQEPRVSGQTTGPRACIDPLKATHLAMTALSIGLGFSPLKAWGTVADLAAHVAEVGLKFCEPDLKAPPDKVITPPVGTCAVSLRIPITRDALEQIVLDSQVLELVLADPGIELPSGFKQALRDALDSPYGEFTNETTGEYSNVYAIVLPGFSTAIYPSHWGDVGAPEIYHYQSDVKVTLTHPGERINANTVQFRPGVHVLTWTGDTLISGADLVWIPDLSNLGPTEEKAKKETVKETWKQTLKRWIRQAKDAAQDVYTDIAKNQAKKTKAKLLKLGKKKAATYAAKKSVGYVLDEYFLSSYSHGVTTVDTQRIVIIDRNAPTISGNSPITVEALEPGGVSANQHINALKDKITVSDDCDLDPTLLWSTPAFWPLSLQADGSSVPSEITWIAQDNGAVDVNGGRNETRVTQQVTVVDTKPPILVAPPPVIMEATGSAINPPLGSPQVFDVADLRPTITNNAPAQFTQGIYRIAWTATDFSGNVSAQTKDTTQIVNIKQPGTNKLPTAFAQTGGSAVQAIADEPIKITVRGKDGDSTPDPLWFSIENQPQHGFFIAPLYPYFINDYRMTARYSPSIAAQKGEAFAWQIAQDPNSLRDYIKSICLQGIADADLPKDFVNNFEYFAVDEDNYTYIYDSFYNRCDHGDGSNSSPDTAPRISVWDQNGNFVGQQVRDSGGYPLHSVKFNVARGTIIAVQSDGSTTGTSLVDISRLQPQNTTQPVETVQVYGLHNDVNNITVGASQTSRRPEYKNARAAALDNERGILYLIGTHNLTGLAAFKTAPCANRPEEGPIACLDLLGVQVYSLPIIQSTKWNDFPGIGVDAMQLQQINDIALDSQGAVYISANNGHGWSRIYKFAPPIVTADGAITLGELMGWMGKCDSGPNCDYIHQRSIGFLCTDTTCALDDPNQETGDRPGQFDGIASLAFDRNDVLYVGDGGNHRVQRFSRDGLFAGEARSTGDGGGFVLGDFAGVGNIAVNSRSFYIVDTFREIVHVFDAAVIHGLDESSAWVEYQSNSNYVGQDSFTFAATDGFRQQDTVTGEWQTLKSTPATVAINVSRNHRPPIATAGLTISTTEDTPVGLALQGQDLDNFGTVRDTLTYAVTGQPEGTLSGAGANLTYTPHPDFNGEDSFYFTVSDGQFTSEPEEFRIGIAPVNDAPTVQMPANLQTGIGFPVTLDATVLDPEIEDTHSVTVDWGDGTVQSNGQIMNDGSLSGPVITGSDGITRTLLAYHTYTSGGAFTVKATVIDSSGAKGEATTQVTISAMADLAIERNGTTVVSANRANLAYDLIVSNRTPSSGGGIAAANVTVKETLATGLTYRLAAPDSGSCTPSGTQLSCNIGTLAPGATVKIRVVADADPALNVGKEITSEAEVTLNEPDPIPDNNIVGARVTMLPVADFLVDSFEEGADANPGDGFCATGEGLCTIRAAVQEANALPSKQVLALTRSLYMLNFEAPTILAAFADNGPLATAEDGAVSGDLDITDNLEIVGLSAEESVIHANSGDRVIEVLNGATLILRDVGLTGGMAIDNGPGGGLYNNGGTVLLERVSVNDNFAGTGGGIANGSGSLRIIASSITGNSTIEGGGGGGISNEAELVLENVTLSGNSAGSGGGILAQAGNATLTNVTLYSNVASGAGGGINSNGTALTINNTILAGNRAEFGPNCGSGVRSTGHNLLGDLTDCSIFGETSSNIIVADVGMDILSANEAKTFSHMPLDTSKAVDAGTCELADDQRGVARPVGPACDIGAIEYGGLVVVSTLYLPVAAR